MAYIWHKQNLETDSLNLLRKGTMAEWMEISFSEVGDDYLKATMPVDDRTRQPYGLLHGGASAALAETIGSVASAACIDPEKQICVGIEINCNHIKGKKDGVVTATAKVLHLGATTHVWDIRITDEQDRLVCISRLTVAVLARKGKA
ncbi:hotdog fold thioesterase [Taibaiella soli]|uniref:Esterase n=1 Tax=Taibaiella soli TaxID=1649169 RepID=A0A2W2BVC5_9BACT|nr:hotdog fold thioesterase [Taibaiella soli]PZF71753.1 esterase [Taibaiella soli]